MVGVEWRKWYMDVMLVPLGFLVMIGYHVWLWHKVRTHPLSTIIGTNARARRFWVSAMIKEYWCCCEIAISTTYILVLLCICIFHQMIYPEDSSILKDNEKKNILAVQTLRNTIMGSTLMATTSILLSTGLAAVISSTYSVKKPLNDAVYGAHGEFTVALKYVTLLTLFLFSFLCHSLSICFINQVNILINSPQDSDGAVSPEYVAALLEKGFVLNTIGNRLFYSGLPLLLWIFGPVLVFLCSLSLVPILYNLDFVFLKSDHSKPNPKSISNTSATSVTITSTHFA